MSVRGLSLRMEVCPRARGIKEAAKRGNTSKKKEAGVRMEWDRRISARTPFFFRQSAAAPGLLVPLEDLAGRVRAWQAESREKGNSA